MDTNLNNISLSNSQIYQDSQKKIESIQKEKNDAKKIDTLNTSSNGPADPNLAAYVSANTMQNIIPSVHKTSEDLQTINVSSISGDKAKSSNISPELNAQTGAGDPTKKEVTADIPVYSKSKTQ